MTTIGLVAHDQMKLDIVEWCVKHKEALNKATADFFLQDA